MSKYFKSKKQKKVLKILRDFDDDIDIVFQYRSWRLMDDDRSESIHNYLREKYRDEHALDKEKIITWLVKE